MIRPTRRRSPELMDAPTVDVAELARSLADLERVNRWLGGSRVVIHSLGPLLRRAGGGEIRVLDVGTGSADIPLALARWAARAGLDLHIVATDLHPLTVRVARERTTGEPRIVVEEANALALPYADGAFDFSMCHTALHHFDPPDAVRALAELGRVASKGVVVTDLVRSWVGIAGVRLLAATVWRRHPITRHDGPVSLRGAYTAREVLALAREAGLRRARTKEHLLANRVALVAEPPGLPAR